MTSKKEKVTAISSEKSEKSRQEAVEILEKGELLAESFNGILAMFATTWKGMGIAAYALAKTWACLQSVAETEGVDVKWLFEDFSKSFKVEFDEELNLKGSQIN